MEAVLPGKRHKTSATICRARKMELLTLFDEEADDCPHITYEGEPLYYITGIDTRQPIG